MPIDNQLNFEFMGDRIQVVSDDPMILGSLSALLKNFRTLEVAEPRFLIKIEKVSAAKKFPVAVYRFKGVSRRGWLSRLTSYYPDGTTIDLREDLAQAIVRGNNQAGLAYRAYQLMLSKWGEWQDLAGRHRIHALGILERGTEKAFLLVGDSGLGKSTLACEFLKSDSGFLIYSDESPLIDSKGVVYPFPLAVALDSKWAQNYQLGSDSPILNEQINLTIRGKVLVQSASQGGLGQSMIPPKPLAGVLLARRSERNAGMPIPLERRDGRFLKAGELVRYLVAGHGCAQMAEHQLRFDRSDPLRLGKIVNNRIKAARYLWSNVPIKGVDLGNDPAQNAHYLTNLIRNF